MPVAVKFSIFTLFELITIYIFLDKPSFKK